MTAYSLEPMDMTKSWVSYLYQVFMPSGMSWTGLKNGCLTWLVKNFPFLCNEKLLGGFHCMFCLWLSICYMLGHPIRSAANFICQQVDNKYLWSGSNFSHMWTCHSTASTMFDRWCSMLWSLGCSFPYPYFTLSVILVQVHLGYTSPKNFNKNLKYVGRPF